ncbi:MAG: sulfatase [bacterium]|nr:sulfatase [bacterium]
MGKSTLSRRSLLKASIPASLGAMATLGCFGLKRKDNPMHRPDILFVHCHDLGRRLPLYGETTARTPALQRIAAEGIVFDNFYSTSTLCSPSRGSILTGRYPHQIGLFGLTNGGWDLLEGEKGIPHLLADAGYETVLFGLQHDTIPPHEGRLGYQRRVELPSPHPAPVWEVAAQVAEFIKALPDTSARPPVYMNVGIFEPHRHDFWQRYQARGTADTKVPAYLPDTEGVRRDLARHEGLIEAMDAGVGTVLAALDAAGLADSTLVLFTTDHGIPFPRAKSTVYDAGIGVAAMARWPGRVPAGRREGALLSHVDWLPTLADLVERPVPANVAGRSFLPQLLGQGGGGHEGVFAEGTYHGHYNPVRCVRTRDFKLIRNYHPSTAMHAAIEEDANNGILARDDYPESFWTPPAPIELYAVAADPCEQTNLAGKKEYQAVEADLLNRLAAWEKRTDDPIGRMYETFRPDMTPFILRAGRPPRPEATRN